MKPKIFHIGLSATGLPLNGLQKAFIKNSHNQYEELNTAHSMLNIKMVEKAIEFQPDIIFIQVQTPKIIHPHAIRDIKKACPNAFIVNWTGDVREPIEDWYYDLAKEIDSTLFTNMKDVETFKSKGLSSEYLQIGIDPEIFKPTGDKLANIPPIVFLANNYEEGRFPLSRYRMEIAMAMKKEFGSQFGLYGNGWTFADGSFNHSQHEEAMVYRSAKIAINCSHFNYPRYSSDRMFRIMGSGCACVSHKYEDIEKDFTFEQPLPYPNSELLIFNDIPHLIEKCHYFLDKDHIRQKVASNGQKAVHEKFTFDEMIKNLVTIYQNKKGLPSAINTKKERLSGIKRPPNSARR